MEGMLQVVLRITSHSVRPTTDTNATTNNCLCSSLCFMGLNSSIPGLQSLNLPSSGRMTVTTDDNNVNTCVSTNQPGTVCNRNPNAYLNHTTKQRAVVSVQLNIVTCPTCPLSREKFTQCYCTVILLSVVLSVCHLTLTINPYVYRGGSRNVRKWAGPCHSLPLLFSLPLSSP